MSLSDAKLAHLQAAIARLVDELDHPRPLPPRTKTTVISVWS